MGKFLKKIEVAFIGLSMLIASICTLIYDKSWRFTVLYNYFLIADDSGGGSLSGRGRIESAIRFELVILVFLDLEVTACCVSPV